MQKGSARGGRKRILGDVNTLRAEREEADGADAHSSPKAAALASCRPETGLALKISSCETTSVVTDAIRIKLD